MSSPLRCGAVNLRVSKARANRMIADGVANVFFL
jgi:hypothetical protein